MAVWKPTAEQPKPGSGRVWQAAAVIVILLALGGGLLAWLLFPDPFTRPRFLPLAVYEYHADIPPLAWTRQDAQALRGIEWARSSAGDNSQTSRLLKAELEGLATHPAGEPLVVYLSGYLLVHDGKPYIFPAEEQLNRPSGWIQMADVLRLLRACPARRKLLLLDVMRPLNLPEKGQLRSDGLTALWPLLSESVKEDPKLAILTACSPGQTSRSSQELGRTVFGHFAARGLRGLADGWHPRGKLDGRVKLRELADYVRVCVDHWSQTSFGARQTPALFGGDDDWPLTLVDQAEDEPTPLGDYPPWLEAGWKTLDGWRVKGVAPAVRPAFLAHARAVLEAETRWRAGIDPARVKSDLAARLAAAAAEYAEKAPPAPGEPTTLAAMPDPQGDDLDAFKRILARRDKLPAKAAEDALKPVMTDLEALSKKYMEKGKELAALAVAAAAAQPFGPEAARLLSGVLTPLKGADRFDEVRFLLRLAGRAEKPELWAPEAARLAVQAAVEDAKLRAYPDEALRWVAGPRASAAMAWRKAEAMLFEGTEPWGKGGPELLRGVLGRYRAIRQDLAIADDAIRTRDDALALLPCFVLSNTPPAPIAALERATAEARKLQKLLEEVPADRAGRLADLTEKTQALRYGSDSLQSLTRDWAPDKLPSLIARMKEGRPADLEMGRALLSSACPDTRQRPPLWAAYREGSRLRADKGMEALGPPGPSRPTLPDPGAWDDGASQRAAATLLTRDVDRARAAVLRLRLVSGAGLPEADALLDALRRKPDDGPSWQKLAAVLQSAGG